MIEFHEEAAAEAEAAIDWYAERSLSAALAFLSELESASDRIKENPQAWPPHVAGTRRYVMRKFPYCVIYREFQGALQVVAVAHAKRRPGYWRGRVIDGG